jgi:hypothetical protein
MGDRPARMGSDINSSLPISFSKSDSVICLPHASANSGMTFSRNFGDVPMVMSSLFSVYPM